MKKWQLDRLINDAYSLRACDTALVAVSVAKNMCDSLLSVSEMLNRNLKERIKVDSMLLDNKQMAIESLVAINRKREKSARWQGRKEGALVGLLAVLLIVF